MAKVAGTDSPLLQISADERARVARVAESFSEEDLTRFLQIMLRTHDELGYRPEQRFHLELGMLKMVHAQRLLPVEELLSQVAPASKTGNSPPSAGTSSLPSSALKRESPQISRPSSPADAVSTQPSRQVSPFEADRARKTPGK